MTWRIYMLCKEALLEIVNDANERHAQPTK